MILAAAGVAAAALALPQRGLSVALRHHWLKQADVHAYRTLLRRAAWDERRLPKLRGQVIAAQLRQLTPMWDSYTRPRALALFSQLQVNLQYLETHRIPPGRIDVAGDDGVVYRWYPGHGLEFHPLASFAALDSSRDPALADALVARGIPRGDRLLWEYSFTYGSGRPPWASGMAQAVAAQALARAGRFDAARRAYLSVPPLTMQLSAGPWIRLYGFDSEVVLNAQLQTAVSLREYARLAADDSAAALADRLLATAQALFPRFDTGEWSRYELGGGYATRAYETFVTTLLARVGAQTQDPFWKGEAQRFRDYLYTAPQVTEAEAPPPVWPQPQDGFLDTVQIPITLSQRAAVTLAVAGKVLTYRLGAGDHVLTWKPPPTLPPGTYPVQVATVSYAGNRGTFVLPPLVVQWDTQPPPVTAALSGTMLGWQSSDAGTPWLELAVDLVDPTGAQPPQTLDLGRQPVAGTLALAVPPGTWDATLRAANSAGQTTAVPLGTLQG